ncbi:hypothetical protein MTsDn5_08620 [Alteromonas gracilis]|uniref:immunoglobulin-like domain-containing protein n=1 Tax=Alteromonas gracilis TaxID=1479524 RepID=UPI0036F3C831
MSFTHIENSNSSSLTINGLTLTRFNNPQNTAYGYGISSPHAFSAENINLVTNSTTSSQRIATLIVPYDLAALADKTRIEITVELSQAITNTQIQLLFSKFRTSYQNRFTSSINGRILKMNFDLVPLDAAYFRIDAFDEHAPQVMRYPHRKMDTPLTTDLEISISLGFAFANSAISVLSVTAKATVGASQFNVNGKFRNGKDEAHVTPFKADDTFNQKLPNNLVAQLPAWTFDVSNKDAQSGHLSVTAGSDLVTVATTEGVRVGDVPLICWVYHGYNAELQPLRNSYEFSVRDSLTISTFGVMSRVVEVIDGQTLRLSKPALQSFTPSIADWATRIEVLGTFTPDHACLMLGEDAGSWVTSAITGVQKTDNRAASFVGQLQMHYCSNSDPVERFNFNRLLTTQNNILELYDYTVESFGNVLMNGYFELPTPSTFNNSYNQNLNYDRNVVFITPCKRYAVETYLTGTHGNPGKDTNGHYNCDRVNVVDLFGNSVPYIADRKELVNTGISKASRAFGGNIMAGVIRKEELENVQYSGSSPTDLEADLDAAETAIPHAVAFVVGTAQIQSSNYTATEGDQATLTDFYCAKNYSQQPEIINSGTGYSLHDVIYLNGDGLMQTRLTVTQVGSNGEVLSVFCTHCGMYWDDVATPTHSTTTNGSGTGFTLNSIGYIEQYSSTSSMQSVVYPAAVVDNIAAKNKFAGCIPMGGVFTINPNIDLRTEYKTRMLEDYAQFGELQDKHSLEFYAVLCAIKKYGMRIVDVATETTHVFQVDSRVPALQHQRLGGFSDGVYKNSKILRTMLVPVQNYTPFSHMGEEDNSAPVIAPITESFEVPQYSDFSDLSSYAYDDIEGDISSRLVTTGTVNTNELGSYTLTDNVSDLAGNAAQPRNRLVTVVEAQELEEPDAPLSVNLPPQEVISGQQATFTGTVSGGTGNYTFEWRYSTGPIFELSSMQLLNPTFTPEYDPLRTRAVYTLEISDGQTVITRSKEITVQQSSESNPIEIDLNRISFAEIGQLLVFDGRNSSTTGSAITWTWTIDKPSGSASVLDDSDVYKASYTPDVTGDYTVTLTLTDEDGNTATATRTTTVYSSDWNPVYNQITLTPTLRNAPPLFPKNNSSLGAIFRGRDARITIEIDNGETDASEFGNIVFALYPLIDDVPIATRSVTAGSISIDDGRAILTLTADELSQQGRHYFEIIVTTTSAAQIMTGYLTVMNTRTEI